MEAAARQAGYFVSVASLSIADAAHMTRTLEHFMAQAVEGVVVIAPQVSVAKAAELIGAAVPVVLVASDVPKSAGYQSVSVDQQGGARLAVGHLIDLGHRDIAHLAGPIEFYDGRARVRGWRHEMKAAGLPVREPLVGDWSPDSGYELGRQMIKRGVPDAVFAANDQMALGLMQALGEAGLSVPERCLHRRIRRHRGLGILPAAAVHGAPGLRRPRAVVHDDDDRSARGPPRREGRPDPGPTRGALEHGTAVEAGRTGT